MVPSIQLDRSRDDLNRETGWTLGPPPPSATVENSVSYNYSATDGRLAGVLTTGDLTRLAERGADFLAHPVHDVMTAHPRTTSPDELAAAARADEKVQRSLGGREIARAVVRAPKVVSFTTA